MNAAVRRTGGGAAVSQSITFTSGTTHCCPAVKGEMMIMIYNDFDCNHYDYDSDYDGKCVAL